MNIYIEYYKSTTVLQYSNKLRKKKQQKAMLSTDYRIIPTKQTSTH